MVALIKFCRQFCTFPTMKVLNVAEKNAAASTISSILGKGQVNKREGQSKFNKVFEFPYNIFGQNCQMVMTSVSGHLMSTEFPGNYRKWEQVPLLSLFEAPVLKNVSQNMLGIQKTLEQQARYCQKLIIWTDCDREGENIGFEIIDVVKKVNPRVDIYRAKFSEMTPAAIHRAVNNLGRPDLLQSQAVDVRSELDLRTGAAFTRFQTLRLQKLYKNFLDKMVISYGSCQFPTLGFVVDRFKQIQEFITENFWKIKMSHNVGSQVADFSWSRVRLFDEQACRAILQLLQENSLATTTAVVSKPKQKWRPQALDTVEMEKLSVRKLKITAKKAMTMAESLYTRGIISYPRTETNIFPKELNLNRLIEQHQNHNQWGEFAGKILQEGGARPRNGRKTDNAHPPIHPTKSVQRNEFKDNDEWRLYDLITRHFLACCSADAEGKEYIVEAEINGEHFTASGLTILALNYLEVYPFDRWSEKTIPEYQQGQTFEPTFLDVQQGQTAPPPLLTEADLISLMEKHGIGTDATHAEHIDKIQQRLYVGMTNERRFTPGQLGMGLVEGYDSMGFNMSKPNLRAEFEADLQRICDGTVQAADVLANYIAKYRDIFRQAVEQCRKLDEAVGHFMNAPLPGQNDPDIDWGNDHGGGGGGGNDGHGPGGGGGSLGFVMHQGDRPQNVLSQCPSCQAEIVLKTRKNSSAFYFGCAGYPQCRIAVWLPESVTKVVILDEVCQTCRFHPHLVELTFKPGETPAGLETNRICCIGGCDATLCGSLGIKPLDQCGSSSSTYSRQSSAIMAQPPSALATTNQSQNSHSFPVVSSENVAPFQNRSNLVARPISFGQHAAGNNVLCICNNPAVKLTVRKDGPNQGRQFYKCADSACEFFLWDDGEDIMGSASRPIPPSNSKLCTCGKPAIKLVAKNGVNAGRSFWSCRRQGEGGCGKWLEWADDDSGENGPITSYTQTARSQNINSGKICSCGQPALRLVAKQGQNAGRAFWTCRRENDGGCGKWLEWAVDGDDGGQSQGNPTWNSQTRPAGRGRGSNHVQSPQFPVNRPGFLGGGHGINQNGNKGKGRKRPSADGNAHSAPKQRKCGVCGGVGHNKKNCPNA